MIITRPRGPREYILKRERDLPEDAQAIFMLDDLKERDRVRVMDTLRVGVGDGSGEFSGTGTRVYTAVRAGLKGWKGNMKYDDGADIPFVCEAGSKFPSDDTLSLLLWEDKVELCDAILSAAFPTEDDKEK